MGERLEDILNDWAQELRDMVDKKPWGIDIDPERLEVSTDDYADGFVWPVPSTGKLEPARPTIHYLEDHDSYLMDEFGYDVFDGPPRGLTVEERMFAEECYHRIPLEGSTTNRNFA